MNIYYNDGTLFVNFSDTINNDNISLLKRRVFTILDDYDIGNIVLKIISNNKNNVLIDDFIKEYHKKYQGNILIK